MQALSDPAFDDSPAGRRGAPASAESRVENLLKRPLEEAWYCIGASAAFTEGRLRRAELCDTRIVIGRDPNGALFALRDRCPHRGMALSKGRLVEGEIVCPFHGWRFRTDGQCVAIPALAANETHDLGKIGVAAFVVAERAGLAWINLGADTGGAAPIPDLDFAPSGQPLLVAVDVEASFDLVVLSLVDPAHVAFVHDSWWWRPSKSLREKVKQFRPSPFGFTMTSHQAPATALAYRLLGGAPDIEIEFRLPGVRLERVAVGARRLVNYTFATPLSARRTRLINVMAWNAAALNLLRPLVRPFARQFLNQDKAVLEAAQEGLEQKPSMVLLGASDLPSQWYFNLKREFIRAKADGRAFANPLQPKELRWRS